MKLIGAAMAVFGQIKSKLFGRWTRPVNFYLFVSLICLGTLLLYQQPLWSDAVLVSDLPSGLGIVQLASLQVLQFCLLATLLFWISTVSIVAMKVVSIVFALTNAAALYFMWSYQMVIDATMVANILNTDAAEASGLWDAGIVPYVLVLGVIPSLLIWKVTITKPRWFWRLGAGVVSVVCLIAFLFATSFTWLWYDQNATRLGSKILPWSYVINTARYYNQLALNDREQVLLPAATFLEAAPTSKEIVVLVIGESARAENFSLYGHDQDTNAFTAKTSLVALPAGLSCATNTISSTACILTHEGREASSHTSFEPLPSYMTRSGIETFYRTNNSGPPPVKTTHFERAKDIAAACDGADCPDGALDESLNWHLGKALAASTSDRIFVTLHQKGSHGPAYVDRYPADFGAFAPVCDSVQVSKCTEQSLINAYDNSILYTDFLLADLITQLDAIPNANVAMLYVSDHGQSLGEGGYYLHGAPVSIAPKEQLDVPFLVWMSDGFMQTRGLRYADIMPETTYAHDFPFHSVMGAFGMRSEIYKPEFDIFSRGN